MQSVQRYGCNAAASEAGRKPNARCLTMRVGYGTIINMRANPADELPCAYGRVLVRSPSHRAVGPCRGLIALALAFKGSHGDGHLLRVAGDQRRSRDQHPKCVVPSRGPSPRRTSMRILPTYSPVGGVAYYSCFWTVNSTYRGVNFTTESAAGRLIIASSMRTRWRPSTPPGRRMTTRSASGSSKLKS